MNRHVVSIASCAAALLVISGCAKDDNTNPTGNNPPGNNPNTGTLKITAWSPERPYPDDVITITGTGFSDDDTANHVRLNALQSGRKDLVVISATATELKVRIPAEDSLTYLPLGWKDVFRIMVGSTTYNHDKQIAVRAPLRIYGLTTHGTFVWYGLRPGSQTEIEIQGIEPTTGVSLSLVGGGALTIDSIGDHDAFRQRSTVYCSSKPSLMMPAPVPWLDWLCDSTYTSQNLAVHANGRSATKLVGVEFLPDIRYYSLSPTVFKADDLNKISEEGGVAHVMIHGKNLYGIARSPGSPEQVIGGYTDEFAFQIGGLGWKPLNPGNYQIIIQTQTCHGVPGIVVCGTYTVV